MVGFLGFISLKVLVLANGTVCVCDLMEFEEDGEGGSKICDNPKIISKFK